MFQKHVRRQISTPSLFQWMSRLGKKPALLPRKFPSQGSKRIRENQKIEEETIPDYVAARYYPVRIGEVFASRYQVVGKLGFGSTSTVWLARDLNQHSHVTLKLFIRSQSMGNEVEHELNIYKRLNQGSKYHAGRAAVRTLLDSFKVSGPDGEHHCLVHPPLWDSVSVFLGRNPIHRLPKVVLAVVLRQLFRALDFIHNECRIIHTDIKADNIMFGIDDDDAVFEKFEKEEQRDPSPRKEIDGRFIYVSRELSVPQNLGAPVLCDFGSAVFGDIEHDDDVQPDVYRSPEVILGVPWSYPIDVWNAGCMIWDVFENRHLFYGIDPEHHTYRGRAHLAEIIALLGPPPPKFVASGNLRKKFFSEDGKFQAGIKLPASTTLEALETNLEGRDKELFMQLTRKMLQWKPEDRKAAHELIDDPWLKEQYK